MKKIFTLLFAVGIVGMASAQSGKFDHGKKDNGYSYNDSHIGSKAFSPGYDDRVVGNKMDSRMNPWEREKQMRYMEQQRGFEKRKHEYEVKRFTGNNRHRW